MPSKLRKRCINPFDREIPCGSTGLRKASANIIKYLTIEEGSWLCSPCRRIAQAKVTEHISKTIKCNENISEKRRRTISPEYHYKGTVNIDTVTVNPSASKKWFQDSQESTSSTTSNTPAMVLTPKDADSPSSSFDNVSTLQSSLFNHLKEQLSREDLSRNHKIQILTLLPPEWSYQTIIENFPSVTHRMIKISKSLYNDKGILSTPDMKQGKTLNSETVEIVMKFYRNSDVSALMPGKKDVVRVKDDKGNKKEIQKRLLLGTLRELYSTFKEEHPDLDIGFSRFASLRPPECVFIMTSGTHTVCVCTTHQNAKLSILGFGLQNLTAETEFPLSDYKDCINFVVCEESSADCFLKKCDNCPGISKLQNFLQEILLENEADTITFKQWINDPQCTLETISKTVPEFIEYFCDQIQNLLSHDFICKEQSKYLKNLKESLQEGEFLCLLDFAENYAFVVQQAVQGFHWNNNQSTIFTSVIYYRTENKLEHTNFIVTSDNLTHDAVAVYSYIKLIVDSLKEKFPNVNKIYYFSDGAPQQFKNYKNIFNLYFHEKDFGILAEWHFFPTAHGKGPCDGLGGSVKRMAASASLQLPLDRQILTPQALHDWFKTSGHFKQINFIFSLAKNYTAIEKKLKKRFSNKSRVLNLRLQHAIIPTENGIKSKMYSTSTEEEFLKLPAVF